MSPPPDEEPAAPGVDTRPAPLGVKLAIGAFVALLAGGGLYLGLVRGEAIVIDLSALGGGIWCF